MMKKNDTTYLVLLLFQAIGILMNLIRVLFDALTGTASVVIMYLFSIISPIIVFYLEYKNINCSEWLQIALARMYILFSNERKAKEVLINIISKYDKSYTAHKLLAEIYEKEGGMRKAIDEYVKVLDLKPSDYMKLLDNCTRALKDELECTERFYKNKIAELEQKKVKKR